MSVSRSPVLRLRAREVYSPTLAAAFPRSIEPLREGESAHHEEAEEAGRGKEARVRQATGRQEGGGA